MAQLLHVPTSTSRPGWRIALWGAAALGVACGPASWKPASAIETAVRKSALERVEVMEGSLARVRQREISGIDLSGRIYRDERGVITSVEKVASYLESVGSPMAPHASQILESANKHGVDPRLIVAIAGVESTYGRKCRGFNAWGWNNGKTRWRSWSAAIEGFSEAFASGYPHRLNPRRFASTYNPNTPEAWSRKVTILMASIESFPIQAAAIDTHPA